MRFRGAWPALGYAVVFTAVAWPWLRTCRDAVPFGNPFAFADDARFWVWQLGWVAHALATNPWGVLDANIHHPAPAQLTSSEHLASTQLVAVPAVWLTGNPVLVANLLVLLSYPLAALAMQRLLVALGCAGIVAWTGGLVFALGPLRVPGNLEVIHFLNAYLALAALALHRLRAAPRVGRAVALCAALTAGMLSGYYLAAMLAVTTAVWSAFELARRVPGRARFLGHLIWAGAAATVVLLVVSIPYFDRPEQAVGMNVGGFRAVRLETLSLASTATLLRLLFGVVPGVLALAGLAALGARDAVARRLAVGGVLVVAAGLLLVFPPPVVVAALEASPLRFLRAQFRFATVAGLGTALLAAAALELVRARLGARAAAVAAIACAALVVTTLGPTVAGVRADPLAPFGAERPLHAAVGETARRDGPGPLLVLPLIDAHPDRRGGFLPLGQLESDDMVGSLHHWLPLVGGHTGYPPLHRPLLEEIQRALPRSEALDELVDLTHVRWLLLRPPDYWKDPALPEQLLALPGVESRWVRDGWVLARVDRPVRRPQWYAAVAAGYRPGHTVLGTPLEAIVETDAIAVVRTTAPVPLRVEAGSTFPVEIELRNGGRGAWPVVVPAGAPSAHTVRYVMAWRRLDASPMAGVSDRLRRDVPVGDAILQVVAVRAPRDPGDYELTVTVEQDAGARFDGQGNVPLRARLVVAETRPAR